MPTKQKNKARNRLTEELLETVGDMRASGLVTAAVHRKITMRHLGEEAAVAMMPISADDIRLLREKANLSQAVFARYLNLTVGYVSQLERGAKRPTGAALAMLNVIKRKGIDVIF